MIQSALEHIDLNVPLFCFTTDIDWAPESMIQEMFSVFGNTPLTVFLTHQSETITKRYSGKRKRFVGLHPNFFTLEDYDRVIDKAVKLWKEAQCFRSHKFFDKAFITKEFYDRGFKYDSNLYLHLQSHIIPFKHAGLMRFPVFFEDRKNFGLEISELDTLKTPGLKIFVFHPIHIALNTPDMEFYLKAKGSDSWPPYKRRGMGTFLEELLELTKNCPKYYLDVLYRVISGKI